MKRLRPAIFGLISAVVVIFLLADLASAGTITVFQTVPPEYAYFASDSSHQTLIREEGRTYQMQFTQSELPQLVAGNSTITGMRFRIAAPLPSWPYTTATWSNYDIWLSEAANSIASMSPNFASNEVDPVQVRNGSLTFATNSFPGLASPNGWGPWIDFSTSSYLYQGGDLVITVRHDSGTAIPSYLGAVVFGDDEYGSSFRAMRANSYTATTADSRYVNDPFIIINLRADVNVPEPSTLLLFGSAVALLFSYCTRRKS